MAGRGWNTRVEISMWKFSSILSESKLSPDCKVPLGFFSGGLSKMEPLKWMTFNLSHDKGAHILNKHCCLCFDEKREIKLSLQCGSSNNNNNNRKPLSVKKCWQFVFGCNNEWVQSTSFTSFTLEHLSQRRETQSGRARCTEATCTVHLQKMQSRSCHSQVELDVSQSSWGTHLTHLSSFSTPNILGILKNYI